MTEIEWNMENFVRVIASHVLFETCHWMEAGDWSGRIIGLKVLPHKAVLSSGALPM